MVQLTTEQRVFLVTKYFETKSFATVKQLFRVQFPDRVPPNKTTIWKNVRKYLDNGFSLNLNEPRSGRRSTGRSNENINAVREALKNNPEGIYCRVNELRLPSATFNRIVRLDLG